tara:strand:+ start:234 stop:458 length:225 start_codon:yes stop_codon:yes gene_type:complete
MNTLITKEDASNLKKLTGFDSVIRKGKSKVEVHAYDFTTDNVQSLLNKNGFKLVESISGKLGNNDLLIHIATKI